MATIFLVGPTASGKTAVALALARQLDADLSAEASAKAEIVSADSMQVYRGMDIGTAKPSPRERKAVRHHLIDVCEVDEVFDVKRFADLARNAITAIHKRKKTALVVGGTGLYVRALRQGLFEGPGRDPKLRAKLELMSTETLYEELKRVDPQTAAKIDRRNPRRLVRALEVFYSTGRPISDWQAEWSVGQPSRLSTRTVSATDRRDARPTGFCLDRDREDLYERIERRIDEQMAAGWLEEARALLARGLEKNATAMQAAGYRELVAHLRGEMTLREAVALIKTRTRQLARRQLTWFRREPGLIWIDVRADEPATETARRIYQQVEDV